MKLFIHIGTHKTGTKSIQAFLRKQADRFESHGLTIPRSGTVTYLSGHHNLALELFCDPRFKPECGSIADMVAELARSQAQRAVISSENFEYLVDQPQLLEQFEQTLLNAGHEVTYIVFHRNVDDYAPSLYAQLKSRSGLNIPFSEFVRIILEDGKFVMRNYWTFYFDYPGFVRKWRSVSQGELHIISFDIASDGIGLLPTFLTAIGAPEEMKLTAAEARMRNTRRASDITQEEELAAAQLLRSRFPTTL